jgi:hypothetical protein
MACEGAEGQVELMLVRSYGENLQAVLRGHVDPLDLVFPGGELTGLMAQPRASPNRPSCDDYHSMF